MGEGDNAWDMAFTDVARLQRDEPARDTVILLVTSCDVRVESVDMTTCGLIV